MKLPRRSLLAGLTTVLAAPATLHWPARAAEFTFKCGSSLPDGHPMAVRLREAMALIKEESGGRLDITLYTNSLLGGDTAMISQTIAGALEMYTLPLDLLAAKNPACGIFGVGYAFLNYDHVWEAMDGELGNYLRGIADQIGFHVARNRCRAAPRRTHASNDFREFPGAAVGSFAQHRRRPRRHCVRSGDPAAGSAVSRGPEIDRAHHALDLGRLPGRRDPSRRHPDRRHRTVALARNDNFSRVPGCCRTGGRRRAGIVAGAAFADRDGACQPDPVLCRARRRLRDDRGADRLHLRHRHLLLSRADHRLAARHRRQPDRRRHLQPAAAGGADVRRAGPADGDDRHRAGNGQFPRSADQPCQRRTLLCAARRDVPRLGDFRVEGGRHGGGGADPLPGDAAPRRASR